MNRTKRREFSTIVLVFLLISMLALMIGTKSSESVQGEDASAKGRSFGVSKKISEIGGIYPQVATDDTGGVYVAWQSLIWNENAGSYIQHVYFAYSHDYGRTWSESIRVNDDGNPWVCCDSPSIAVDQQTGHIYVAWKDNRTGNADVYVDKSVDRGLSFGSNVKVNDYFWANEYTGNPYWVNVEVGDTGDLYVAWRAYVDPAHEGYDILFASSNDGGQTFAPTIIVNPIDTNGTHTYPWIEADKEGKVYVSYSKWMYGSYKVYVYNSRSLNGASSFETPVQVNDNINLTGYRGKKEVVVSKDGKIHVVWTDGRSQGSWDYGYWDIYFATSMDGGLSFGHDVRVNDDLIPPSPGWGKTVQGTASLAIDSYGHIHVVWEDFRNYGATPTYTRDIYYAFSEDGLTFYENVKINHLPDATWVNSADPNMVIDSCDNLFVVWADSPYDEYDYHIYFAFSSAHEFLETDLNQDGTVNILDIAIVAQAFGCKEGDENWNETADLDENGEINILDVAAVAKDYGRTL